MMLAQSSSLDSPSHLGKQLLEASKNGNDDDVRALMAKGAPFTCDWLGASPLHMSCMNGHVSTTQILARAGVSWEGRTKADKTPLHLAAQHGHHEVVEVLLKFGADIDTVDMLQMTPVHWAVVEEHFLVIKMLLEHQADLNIKNKFDRTPLETAQDACNFHIVEYLKSSTNQQTYDEDEIVVSSPIPDSSQAGLESLAALSGSPSLAESLPWLNQDSSATGASVLLEGAHVVTLTEAGKLALQAWSNIYEDEAVKENEETTEATITDGADGGQKVLSITLANQMLNTPTTNFSASSQPLRFLVTSPVKKTSKPSGNKSPVKRKRKLSTLEQTKELENDDICIPDHKELQRQLAEAQSEVALYREKLQLKEKEVYLWKKRYENNQQQSRT